MRTKKPLRCPHCAEGKPCTWHMTKAQQQAWYDLAPAGDGTYRLAKRDRARLFPVTSSAARARG